MVAIGNLEIHMHILFADDQEFEHELLRSILIRENHQIIHCKSGEELLDKLLGTTAFDVVITDNDMGGGCMEGIDVLKILRANERFASLPVIVRTAQTDLGFIQRVAALRGMYLYKSTRFSESRYELLHALSKIGR